MSTDCNILAIDTAWAACSVAFARPNGAAVARHEPMTSGHAERLFPLMQEVLDEATATFADVEAIAVTVGPGSFTGVRVGVAAARGLALAAKLPTLGATSLAPMARLAAKALHGSSEAMASAPGITVLQDARRGNAFVQEFDASGRNPLSEARIIPVDELEAELATTDKPAFTGSAVELLRETAPALLANRAVVALEPSMATAGALIEVELEKMHPLKPLYLRAPDAKPQDGKSLLRQRS